MALSGFRSDSGCVVMMYGGIPLRTGSFPGARRLTGFGTSAHRALTVTHNITLDAAEYSETTRAPQSSILAQYILLLLTDYCTKGYCNPGDQRFAIEMGRQGIQDGKNISLYAVSKAMGFIPRNKLGHSFFRCACVSHGDYCAPLLP